jgi:CDP-diacylglycerol pyrophosphatase
MKLTDEEREELVQLQAQWNGLTKKYGELHYQKKLVDADLLTVDSALEDLDAQRTDAVNRLQTKYGIGQVNLQTGDFIPTDTSPTT